MSNGISTLGVQVRSVNSLATGLARLNQLTDQLTTGRKSLNLIDYSASEASSLLNFTNSITKREGYLSVLDAITPRVEAYDAALTGMETSTTNAISSIIAASSYNAATNDSLASGIQGYLADMSYYLNQKVADRYIFSGTRYTTAPVIDLSTLPEIETFGNASTTLQTNCITFTSASSGTFGNDISVTLSAGTAASTTKVTVSVPGQDDEVFDDIAGSGNTLWTNIATRINVGQTTPTVLEPSRLITAVAGIGTEDPVYDTTLLSGGTGSVTNGAASAMVAANGMTFATLTQGTWGNGVTVTVSDATTNGFKVTVACAGYPTETYDDIDASGTGVQFWTDVATAINGNSQLIMATAGVSNVLPTAGATTPYALTGGTSRVESNTYVTADGVLPTYDTEFDSVGGVPDPNSAQTAAYTKDRVAIDTSQILDYGITSNQEGFQQIIMGLRFAYKATQDIPNYKSLMETAKTLLTDGLNAIRGYHSGLSSDSATLDTMEERHTKLISNIKDQITNIQGVDTNEVAVKITTYQASLEASYSATAKMVNLSILNYM